MSEILQNARDLVKDLFTAGKIDNSSIIEGIVEIENTLNQNITTANQSSEIKYIHEVLRYIISEFVLNENENLFEEMKLTSFLHTCCLKLEKSNKARTTTTDSYRIIHAKIWKAGSSVLALIVIAATEDKELKKLFKTSSSNNNPTNIFKVLWSLITYKRIGTRMEMEEKTRELIKGAVEMIRIKTFRNTRKNSLINIVERIFQPNSIYSKTASKCLGELKMNEILRIDLNTVFYVVWEKNIHPGFL